MENVCNYVIWMEFDDEYTEFLNKKCKALDENNIKPGIRPPHLTLTFFKTNDRDKLIEFIKSFVENNSINIKINSISAFSEGVLFYAPSVTSELLEYHNNFCKGLCEFGELSWDLYYPGKWTPHIALTSDLNGSDILKAFSIMREGFEEKEVGIKRIMISGNGKTNYVYTVQS